MIAITVLLFTVVYVNGFTIEFPYGTKFMARIRNINLNKINDETKSDLQYLFKTTPVLVFEKQNLLPEEQYYISSFFDEKYNNQVMHPFNTAVPSVDQIAIRGKGIANHFGVDNVPIHVGKTFKYTEVWHQDLVGVKDVLPPIVSSMYMIETPEWGGKTKFASLENAYESMSYLYKSFYKNTESTYLYDNNNLPEIDFTGYGRIDKYWKNDLTEELKSTMVTQPLIIYPTEKSTKKTFMITPNKLYKFNTLTPSESQEKMRYIMKNFILAKNNVGTLSYRKNDFVIFNNRKVIHTSTPTEEYSKDRILSILFLGTDEPLGKLE